MYQNCFTFLWWYRLWIMNNYYIGLSPQITWCNLMPHLWWILIHFSPNTCIEFIQLPYNSYKSHFSLHIKLVIESVAMFQSCLSGSWYYYSPFFPLAFSPSSLLITGTLTLLSSLCAESIVVLVFPSEWWLLN